MKILFYVHSFFHNDHGFYEINAVFCEHRSSGHCVQHPIHQAMFVTTISIDMHRNRCFYYIGRFLLFPYSFHALEKVLRLLTVAKPHSCCHECEEISILSLISIGIFGSNEKHNFTNAIKF